MCLFLQLVRRHQLPTTYNTNCLMRSFSQSSTTYWRRISAEWAKSASASKLYPTTRNCGKVSISVSTSTTCLCSCQRPAALSLSPPRTLTMPTRGRRAFVSSTGACTSGPATRIWRSADVPLLTLILFKEHWIMLTSEVTLLLYVQLSCLILARIILAC